MERDHGRHAQFAIEPVIQAQAIAFRGIFERSELRDRQTGLENDQRLFLRWLCLG